MDQSKKPLWVVLLLLAQFGATPSATAQKTSVLLEADGPGQTYELIRSVLAPGQNPIEAPDRNHPEFGPHITEAWDDTLKKHVFVFHLHFEEDDDRGKVFDRQRVEIKTYNESPAHLKGERGEMHEYRWRFRVDRDFRVSSRFTHLFQIKAVGGKDDGHPIVTVSAAKRKQGDRLEIRHAKTSRKIRVVADADLSVARGRWISGRCRAHYHDQGRLNLRLTDRKGAIILKYESQRIDMWRAGSHIARPKWGIYRKIVANAGLRDEQVRFADFVIEEQTRR